MSKTTDNVAIDFNGKALAAKGYDIVAYFTKEQPVAGKAALSVNRNGIEYRFSTEANRDAFVDNPERYQPQYGGLCAFGVSEGVKLDVDPAKGPTILTVTQPPIHFQAGGSAFSPSTVASTTWA